MYLKLNILKVIKCVTCLVTCFVIVLCSMSAPVSAADNYTVYNLADYYVDSYVSGDVSNTLYSVTDVSGGWWAFSGSSSAYTSGSEVEFKFSAGSSTDSVDLYHYYLGANQNGSFVYNYLSLSGLTKYNTISFDTQFHFTMSFHSAPQGTVEVVWESHLKFYDEDFNFLGVVESSVTKSIPGGGTSGSVYDFPFSVELPEYAAYVVPYQRLTVDPSAASFTSDMSIFAERTQSLAVLVYADADKTEEEIAGDELQSSNDKLDGAAGNLGDAMDDYNDVHDKLPSLPDFGDVSSDDDLNATIEEFEKVFNWDDSGLNYMYVPMTLSLGLAVLFYVVFGKG